MTEAFEPTIIGFTCNWCSYRAADMAGTARMKYPPNVRLIRLMCSGRLDPTFVFKALASGADSSPPAIAAAKRIATAFASTESLISVPPSAKGEPLRIAD